MRQTKFNVAEISAELAKEKSDYKSCLLVNELGVILEEKDKAEAVAAEKKLVELLADQDQHLQMISYCCLISSHISEDSRKILQQFAQDPANGLVVDYAAEVLEGRSQLN